MSRASAEQVDGQLPLVVSIEGKAALDRSHLVPDLSVSGARERFIRRTAHAVRLLIALDFTTKARIYQEDVDVFESKLQGRLPAVRITDSSFLLIEFNASDGRGADSAEIASYGAGVCDYLELQHFMLKSIRFFDYSRFLAAAFDRVDGRS